MIPLADVKQYMRLDDDLIEDDRLIQDLIVAATKFLEQTTGKAYADDSTLYSLAVKMLVCHWYENRSIYSTKTSVNDLPLSLQAIINHISLSGYYAPLEVIP